MTDPWPDDVPDWVKTWEGPETKNEWAHQNRVLLYRYARELLVRGPVTTGFGRGRGTGPQEIMANTAKNFSLTRLKKHLKGFADNPIPVLPKHVKVATTKRALFSPGPAFTTMAPVNIWTGLGCSCYPDHPEAVRLGTLTREIEAKLALNKPITAPWKSYWVCSRTLVLAASNEYESMSLDTADRRELDTLTTIFQRTIEGRARAHAPVSNGTDSGAASDPDLLLHRDSGHGDSGAPRRAAVPADDDRVHEDLETDDLDADWFLPGTDEERGD